MGAAFEFDGEKYRKASKHQKEWGNQLIAALEFNGKERILDLGCGDGVLTERLARLVPEGSVLGIDASMGMIRTARQLQRENLSFASMDINSMCFHDEFDVIFSNAALHWIKDHHNLLQRTFAALRPDGKVFWNFAGHGTCSNFFDVVLELMHDAPYEEHFVGLEWPWFMPSKEEYQVLIDPIGFSSAEITEENRDRYFANAEEMIRWIDQPSIVPFLRCVPEEKKASFRSDVVNRMLQKTLQPDGTCFETFRRICVTAVK